MENTLEDILHQLRPILDPKGRQTNKCEVDGVTPKLLKDLKCHMVESDLAGIWESLRIDYSPDKLIVQFPTFGHEVMTTLFRRCANYLDNNSLSTITAGGAADIPFSGGGLKSPDYSLYERRQGNPHLTDSLRPTVVFETAYTQSDQSLAVAAARHICLTTGRILLVVAIKVSFEPESHPRKIRSITWSHWEEDLLAHRFVPKQEGEVVNEVRAERMHGEDDNIHVLPPPNAFSAVVTVAGRDERVYIRAVQTATWKIFPADPEISEINILFRHLYRDPDYEDREKVALKFKVSDIISAFTQHEWYQQGLDREAKGELGTEAADAVEERFIRNRNYVSQST